MENRETGWGEGASPESFRFPRGAKRASSLPLPLHPSGRDESRTITRIPFVSLNRQDGGRGDRDAGFAGITGQRQRVDSRDSPFIQQSAITGCSMPTIYQRQIPLGALAESGESGPRQRIDRDYGIDCFPQRRGGTLAAVPARRKPRFVSDCVRKRSLVYDITPSSSSFVYDLA